MDDGYAKEGRSSALQEVLDMLTEMEMEPHRPKPPAPEMPPEAPAEEMGGLEGLPPEDGSEGGLSPEDLEMIRQKLESMG